MINDNEKNLKILQQAKTIGELLKLKREQQKISVEEISANTKIRPKIIIDLENDYLTELPSRTYVVGFLKALTEVLGLDYAEALELFDKAAGKKLETKLATEDYYVKENHSLKVSKNNVFILIGFGLVVVGSVITFLFYKAPDEVNRSVIPTTVNVKAVPVKKAIALDVKNVKNSIAEPLTINLLIKAIKGPCWIAYQVDEGRIVKYIMQKGKEILLTGKMIKLHVGNYSVISINKDNTPIKIINESTKNTTIHLIFPENLAEKIKPPFFIFNSNGSVQKRIENEDDGKTLKEI